MEQTTGNKESFGNSTAGIITRYSVYTVGIVLLMFSLPWIAQDRGAAGFTEGSPVETAQLSMIILMALLYLRESFVTLRLRQIFIVFTCFLAFVSFREIDSTLDRIQWVSWKYAYVLVLYAGYLGYSNFESFKGQVVELINFRAFALLWAGFIVAIPFAQLVGNGEFMQAIALTDYRREYKRVIEEVGELMGYLLMLLATIEIILESRAAVVHAHR